MRSRLVCVALLLHLLSAGAARAGEDYFLLMFGSQQIPNKPQYSHSSATFVKVCWPGDGPCPANPVLQPVTISWLPCDMKFKLIARAECGRNFDLDTTLRWCYCNDMRVSLWGPYRICPELYYKALHIAARLEGGRVRYKAVDTGYNSAYVSNCIHAIANVVQGPRVRVATPGWGEMASFYILREYEPYIVQPGCRHDWVALALGLQQYPIIYREYERPRSGAIFGPVYRLLGGESDLQATYGPPR